MGTCGLNLLLTLSKRFSVKQGTLDYGLLTWMSKACQTIKYYFIEKINKTNKKQKKKQNHGVNDLPAFCQFTESWTAGK